MMASRAQAFREWVAGESLTTSGPIDQLKDKRITIDAEDFLETILTSHASREPLLPALGGLPFALRKHVDAYIANFQAANITPTFIFNGLDLACKDRTTILRDSRLAARSLDEAWNLYSQSRADEAVAEFGKSCTYRTYHILRWLQSYLARQGVRVQTAPYTAAAQVVSLDQEGFGDAIFGSMSCLMFGAAGVIIAFDWESQTFTWVEKAKCLAKLGVNEDHFIDFSLISGLTILAPPAELESAPNYIGGAREIVTRAGSVGFPAYDSLNKDFLELFKKAKIAVKHNVVLAGSGEITITQNNTAAGDLHDVIGQRLPDEIYYYMSRGVVGPRVLNWRTRAEVFEIPPLDGGSSPAYQQLVTQKLVPLRTRTMALINTMLHRYYQKKDVELISWYNENNKQSLNVPDASAPTDAANRWRVKSSTLAKVFERNPDLKKSPLLSAASLLSDESTAKETITEKKGEISTGELRESQELLANTVLRFLEDRGYINNDHTLSAWGKALKAAFDHAEKSGYIATAGAKEVEEAIFMAFELHKLDVLSTSQMFPSDKYLGAPMRGTETDKAYTLLLSRVACLGTFHHKEIGFTGPLSRHLLGYHQMTTVVRGSLRDLVEIHALSMVGSGVVSRQLGPADYTTLGSALPFVDEPDLGLSLVVKSFLDELSNEAGKRSDISRWFNHAYNIPGDLEKAWNMWGAINAGIQAADSAIVNNDTKTIFKNANEWLTQKLQQANPEKASGKA